MAKTPSNMLALGTALPKASLPDAEGHTVELSEQQGPKGLLVMFICNHCPFVVHIASFLSTLNNELNDLGIHCVAINSNDVKSYPQDAPEHMVSFARDHNFSFPYLFDESQDVARMFDAACTPDFYLFSSEGSLVYRGQLDDSRPGNGIPVSGADVIAAAKALAEGQAPIKSQKPSLGCNIKWK